MNEQQNKTIFIATDPFGLPLYDALLPYLQQEGFNVRGLGTGDYYTIAANVGRQVAQLTTLSSSDFVSADCGTCGIVLCGTGMGVCIAANKISGIRAAVAENVVAAVNSRSVNNSNVLALGSMVTAPEMAKAIVKAWHCTPFKGPAPANKCEGWPDEVQSFLDGSMPALAELDASRPAVFSPAEEQEKEDEKRSHECGPEREENKGGRCPVCCISAGSSNHPFQPVAGVQGAEWVQTRDAPTRAVVRFNGGSVEPTHHHTHGHDVFVTKGRKRVENLTLGKSFELSAGSYLYTGAGERHRVVYHEDTEFILCCDGRFDVFWDEI